MVDVEQVDPCPLAELVHRRAPYDERTLTPSSVITKTP
jgi:hypothetical protein